MTSSDPLKREFIQNGSQNRDFLEFFQHNLEIYLVKCLYRCFLGRRLRK